MLRKVTQIIVTSSEPDIAPYHIKQSWIDEIAESLPESPFERRKRYVEEYGIKEYDADVILQTKESSDFYDAAVLPVLIQL